MSQPNARAAAAQVVLNVARDGNTLDGALEGVLSQVDPKQQATVRSLSYGALRGFHRYLAVLGKLTQGPVKKLQDEVKAVLCVALFELEDARTPQYAVVDAAVELAKSGSAARAAGLINAVLRRYLRERQQIDGAVAAKPATCHAMPTWLSELIRADWPSRWAQILAESDRQPPMWLRVNMRLGDAASYVARLAAEDIEARVEERVPGAVLLQTPRDVRELPGFADGAVSVQDLGAQCVAFLMDLKPGLKVLDACAAPGGKTSLMAEREPQLARLLALDIDAKRSRRIADNLTRLKLPAEVLIGDASTPKLWWDGVPFERILLDAPCSALGVIRRHPDIRVRKTLKDLEKLPGVQKQLLRAAWGMLAQGGRLVYATCTITRSENRDVIGAFLEGAHDAEIVPVETWSGWPGVGEVDEFGCQILPGEAGADGFYYAVLTKR